MLKKIILSLCISSIISCNNLLEVDLPQDQLTKDLVFKDEKLAKSAMAGVYRNLDSTGFLSGSLSGGGLYLGCYSDELTSYQPPASDIDQVYQLSTHPLSEVVKSLWGTTYNQIYSINSIIEGLEKSSSISPEVKNQLIGEALFLRAILHVYLVNVYNKVPYAISTDYTINSSISSQSKDNILRLAQEDTEKALPLLPENKVKGQRITPTKAAACALLSRISLYQGSWQKAIDYSLLINNNSSYSLETDLKKVFLKEGNSIIWAFQPVHNLNYTNEAVTYILLSAPSHTTSLTQNLISSFNPMDKRLTEWIGNRQDAQGKSYYFAYKYKQGKPISAPLEYSAILRAEEQYLIRAEAYLRLGIKDKSLIDLNIIRTRAGIPPVISTDETVILNAIMEERRHEFFTEYGHRFIDLKRTGTLSAIMKAVKPQWNDKFQNFPLPESELLLNPKLGPQNEGY